MMAKRLWSAVTVVLLLVLANSALGGLMAWYPFEGDVNDVSGNGRDGVAYGDPVYAPGRFGQAMSFDGIDDYVEIAPFKYAGDSGEFSVTFWFKVQNIAATAANNGFPYLFSHGMTNRSNNVSVYFRSAENDMRTHTRLMNPANSEDVRGSGGPLFVVDTIGSGTGLVDGQWHMYALTSSSVDGGTVYIDGVAVGTSPGYKGDLLNLTDMIVLGRRGFQGEATRYFGSPDPNDGLIDDVALWSEALTPDAIGRLYDRGVLEPANIILVTENYDTDADEVQDDQELVNWLTAEGHSVDVQRGYWTVLDPNKIAALNAADLVIMSRSTNSGNYNQTDEPAQWNAVTTPLLQLSAYLVRNNRWFWVNSGAATNNTSDIYLEAVDPNHPVFQGVALGKLDPNDPNDPGNVVQVIDPNVGTGITSFVGTLDMGNGKLIAKPVAQNLGWIAEWEAGAEFYAGSGQIAGGKRMLFCAGTQEVGATPQGAFNLTAEGSKMLRNAIAYLRLQPEPADTPEEAEPPVQ
jgi:hypothetical protein